MIYLLLLHPSHLMPREACEVDRVRVTCPRSNKDPVAEDSNTRLILKLMSFFT